MIIMKLVLVVKIHWFFMVLTTIYNMLFGFINEIFNFHISNVIKKPIKFLLDIFKFVEEEIS